MYEKREFKVVVVNDNLVLARLPHLSALSALRTDTITTS
jgi:hypothetical protein